ncbi:MAG: DUF2520 domain-containing protein [Acidobacteriota bacterium]|nr:DUF2520 domain-containing protein [Acidobacteriota bacterium]
MARKPSIAIVGPGRLGSAIAVALHRVGYRVAEIISSGDARSLKRAQRLSRTVEARHATAGTARLDADVIWFCVPDGKIKQAGQQFAWNVQWKTKIAFHSSGALTSNELDSLRQQGALVASLHPMMTFVSGAIPSLDGVAFGMEGDARALQLARRIVRDLGGLPFDLDKKSKVLYHAWGTFLSPLLVAQMLTAEQVAIAAGLSSAKARKIMLPIVRQTLANYAKLGPANAFSGPIVRGDAMILRQHLKALTGIPEAAKVYTALARAALRYLPTRNRKELKKVVNL